MAAGLTGMPARQAGERQVLTLDNEARGVFVAWHNEVEQAIGPGGAMAPIKALAAKLPEHAARLAAVIALIERSPSWGGETAGHEARG